MTLSLEEQTSCCLRLILDSLSPGNIEDSIGLRDFLSSLEFFLPTVLGEVFPYWKNESLDGMLVSVSRKIAAGTAEFFGLCILMDDQCLTPFHVRLRVSASCDAIEWLECKVGETGDGKVRRAGDSPAITVRASLVLLRASASVLTGGLAVIEFLSSGQNGLAGCEFGYVVGHV